MAENKWKDLFSVTPIGCRIHQLKQASFTESPREHETIQIDFYKSVALACSQAITVLDVVSTSLHVLINKRKPQDSRKLVQIHRNQVRR